MALRLVEVELRYTYGGAAPGLGGIAALQMVSNDGGQFAVRFIRDLTNPDPDEQFELGLYEADAWRQAIEDLDRERAFAFFTEGDITDPSLPWPGRMEILGNRNAAIELIACAWAGPPFSEIARAFTGADDERLKSWCAANGHGFLDRPFLWKFARILRVLAECDLGSKDLSKVVSRLQPGAIQLRDVWAGIGLLIRTKKAEDERTHLASEWELFPFQRKISELVERWKKQNPRPAPTSWTTAAYGGMARNHTVHALHNYLCEYVLTNRTLPAGIHRVPVNQGPSLDIDFDTLTSGSNG